MHVLSHGKKQLVSLQQLSYSMRVPEGDLVKTAQSLSLPRFTACSIQIAVNHNIVK